MTTIGLISDVHARPEAVAEALSIFDKAGVAQILCAGDIAGYNEQLEATVRLLRDSGCCTVLGNHDLLYLDHHEDEPLDVAGAYLKQLPEYYATSIEGKKLYMVHAQPPDGCHGGIKLLDKQACLIPEKVQMWSEKLATLDADVLIVGHTHQVYAEWLASTLVVNPGSTVFNHCCGILYLPEMSVEWFALEGRAIKKTWNWGEHVIYRK